MSASAVRRSRQGAFLIAAGLCALAGAADVQVAARAQESTSLPVRVVNGHLVVLTDLVGLRFTNEASFQISLEYPDALTLHPDQYRWLGLDPNDLGLADPPLVHLLIAGGIKLSIPANEIAVERSEERLEFQNMMTRLHSSDLGERKLKGTIGVGLLRKYHVTLDLSEKQVVLAPPRDSSTGPASGDMADLVVPFEYVNNRVQVAAALADDRRAALVVGGTEYDTFIDSRVARSLAKPAGDVSPLWLAGSGTEGKRLDLSQYVAFRPRPFGLAATPGADSPLVITGVNFLEYFRVELDWVNERIALTQRKVPAYPQQDFAFFDAESRGTAEALEAYLQKYPASRLSPDAASRLVQRRLDQDGGTDADVMKALEWAVRTSPANRRTEICLSYLENFDALPNRTALAIAAGKEGLKYSRDAFDARAVYSVHHRLGQLQMKQQQWNEAWKHLLSAAFMAPDDLLITLDLARVYDKQGQVRRAYARYKRVAAAPGAPPDISAEIKAAMDRLRPQLPKDDPLLRDDQPAAGKGGRGGGRP